MVGVKALANVKSNERASVMMDVVLIVMVLITVSDVRRINNNCTTNKATCGLDDMVDNGWSCLV